MSKYNCPLNFKPSAELCYDETCCFDCLFFENDGHVAPCKDCAAIGGTACGYKAKDDMEYFPKPHERC